MNIYSLILMNGLKMFYLVRYLLTLTFSCSCGCFIIKYKIHPRVVDIVSCPAPKKSLVI